MNQPRRFTLRRLPLAARLTLALFLLSVGLGYLAALVQLHLQHASPGQVLPTAADAVRLFHGQPGEAKSQLRRLIEADESLPFNGTGSMAAAFTRQSGGWPRAIRQRAQEIKTDEPTAEFVLRRERDAERQAMLAWVKSGPSKADFEADRFALPSGLSEQPFPDAFRDGPAVKIKTLFGDRCIRCHAKDGDDSKASQFPLETWEQIERYSRVDPGGGRMSLDKLAQTTHAHLLSFSMLFMLTGVLFALTNFPATMRVIVAPLVLLAQVADIACWWLARIDGRPGELFARSIPITGAIVGAGLVVQIVLTLFHLFGWLGRVVLLVVFIAAGFGGWIAKDQVIEPFLKAQAAEVQKE